MIPNATILIKNTATGVVRQVTTNANGFYIAPNLLPGSYSVSTEAKGFAQVVHREVTLRVGAEQELDLQLKPGQVNEVMEVMDAPSDIQTGTTALTATVESRTVRELPLNGRDWTTLATLEPGVVSIPNQANRKTGGAF